MRGSYGEQKGRTEPNIREISVIEINVSETKGEREARTYSREKVRGIGFYMRVECQSSECRGYLGTTLPPHLTVPDVVSVLGLVEGTVFCVRFIFVFGFCYIVLFVWEFVISFAICVIVSYFSCALSFTANVATATFIR